MYVNKILLSLVVLAVTLISISSKGSELYRNQEELLDSKIPPVIDQLPLDIAEELGKKGDNIGFLVAHDIKTGNVKLLLREDDEYYVLNEEEKKALLSNPRKHIKTTYITIETVEVNPKCQIIIIDGSAEIVCKHIHL